MVKLEEGKKYIVSDFSDNTINVVDIENGNEIDINIKIIDTCKDNFVPDSFDEINETNNINISEDNISKNENKNFITEDEENSYIIDKCDFLYLNLTDVINLKGNKLYVTHEKPEIKNDLAWRLLEDLYISEEETEGMKYKVTDIKENKIYLTNYDGTGGYFSIYKEVYPNLKIGDIVEKHNRKYIKI